MPNPEKYDVKCHDVDGQFDQQVYYINDRYISWDTHQHYHHPDSQEEQL